MRRRRRHRGSAPERAGASRWPAASPSGTPHTTTHVEPPDGRGGLYTGPPPTHRRDASGRAADSRLGERRPAGSAASSGGAADPAWPVGGARTSDSIDEDVLLADPDRRAGEVDERPLVLDGPPPGLG